MNINYFHQEILKCSAFLEQIKLVYVTKRRALYTHYIASSIFEHSVIIPLYLLFV